MKRFLTSILIFCTAFTLFSCNSGTDRIIECSYSDLLLGDYEEIKANIKKNKYKTFYIKGTIKKINFPKDQPWLNESVIYFYDDKIFDKESSVGKFVEIKVKPSLARVRYEMEEKEVVVKCRYKRTDFCKVEEDFVNFFYIEFTNGKIIY